LRILRLDRIINDDDVASTAGQRATDGCCQAIAALRGAELGFAVLGLVDLGMRERPFVIRKRKRAIASVRRSFTPIGYRSR
jgi:hypothetical protein